MGLLWLAALVLALACAAFGWRRGSARGWLFGACFFVLFLSRVGGVERAAGWTVGMLGLVALAVAWIGWWQFWGARGGR